MIWCARTITKPVVRLKTRTPICAVECERKRCE